MPLERSSIRRRKSGSTNIASATAHADQKKQEKGLGSWTMDYIRVSNRWKSLMINVEVKWGPSIHRFGKPFDHGFLSAIWRWKTSKRKKTQRSNFAAMTSQSWPEFDVRLRMKLQQQEEPPKNEVGYKLGKVTVKPVKPAQALAKEYDNLTKCV